MLYRTAQQHSVIVGPGLQGRKDVRAVYLPVIDEAGKKKEHESRQRATCGINCKVHYQGGWHELLMEECSMLLRYKVRDSSFGNVVAFLGRLFLNR